MLQSRRMAEGKQLSHTQLHQIDSHFLSRSPISVVSGINGETTYDYVFGGPLPHRSAVSHSTLKLTSPPVRLRSDSRTLCKLSLNHVRL
jgi:hypothetical protein